MRLNLIVLTVALAGLVLGGASYAADKSEPLRFGHELHQGKGNLKINECQSCHRVDEGVLQVPLKGRDHKPCNDGDCHASEFMSRTPTICVVCHDKIEPWLKQPVRILPARSSEFKNAMSHQKHESDCKTCHGDVLKDEPGPDAHGVCSTCHTTDSSPLMSDCGSCHALGDKATRAKAQYTVSARFRHSTHQLDPRSQKTKVTDCSVCHTDVVKASNISEITPPSMQSCGACHDGGYAFKTTGFGCAKCHGANGS